MRLCPFKKNSSNYSVFPAFLYPTQISVASVSLTRELQAELRGSASEYKRETVTLLQIYHRFPEKWKTPSEIPRDITVGFIKSTHRPHSGETTGLRTITALLGHRAASLRQNKERITIADLRD